MTRRYQKYFKLNALDAIYYLTYMVKNKTRSQDKGMHEDDPNNQITKEIEIPKVTSWSQSAVDVHYCKYTVLSVCNVLQRTPQCQQLAA